MSIILIYEYNFFNIIGITIKYCIDYSIIPILFFKLILICIKKLNISHGNREMYY